MKLAFPGIVSKGIHLRGGTMHLHYKNPTKEKCNYLYSVVYVLDGQPATINGVDYVTGRVDAHFVTLYDFQIEWISLTRGNSIESTHSAHKKFGKAIEDWCKNHITPSHLRAAWKMALQEAITQAKEKIEEIQLESEDLQQQIEKWETEIKSP